MRLNSTQWSEIDRLKIKLLAHEKRLNDVFGRYKSANIRKKLLMEYLEFSSEDLPFFDAFTLPPIENGEKRVGKKGKAMDEFYLLDRWVRGSFDAGSRQHLQPKGAAEIWKMTQNTRDNLRLRWQRDILKDLIAEIQETGRAFNEDQAQLQRVFEQQDASIIASKRIIACTTNGAAKYSSGIHAIIPLHGGLSSRS